MLYGAAGNPKTGYDLWILPLAAGAKPFPLLQTPFNEQNAQFSPDGRWVAYASNESGHFEVYVIPFHPEGGAPGAKRQVSTAGGNYPHWRGDGKEIFYMTPAEKLMAAEVGEKGEVFEAGQVQALFGPVKAGYFYDASADGQRFLVAASAAETTSGEPLTMVQNWTAGMKK